jgi:hypothetical protein
MAKLRQWHPRFWTVGNLRQSSLAEIWKNSPLLEELRSYPLQYPVFDGIDIRSIRFEQQPEKAPIVFVDQYLHGIPQTNSGD